MKSLKYLAIAVAVAGVAMTAAPADAGSVGTKSGRVTKVNVQDKYTKHVTEENDIQNFKDTRTDTKDAGIVNGNHTYDTKYNKSDNNKGVTVHILHASTGSVIEYNGNPTNEKRTKHYGSIQQAKDNAKSLAADFVYDMRKDCSGIPSPAGCKVYDSKNYWGNNVKNAVANSKALFGKVMGDDLNMTNGKWTYGSYKETSRSSKDYVTYRDGTTTTKSKETSVKKWDTEKKTATKDTYKSVKYVFDDGSDALMIGDADNMGKAYAAFGNVTEEHHYDRDEYFLLTHHKHTTVTDVTTINKIKYKDVNTVTTINQQRDAEYNAYMRIATTPIVLDLDGDGKIEASNGQYLPHANSEFSKNAVMFDFYGNGFPVMMEWVGTNDGLLCRPEADGTVKGTNLFGSANGYENGYDELASIDTNKDGVISGAELEGLMVWQDENHNGVADKGELKSLETLGITSISATHNNYSSTYTRNGKSYKTFDWHPNTLKLTKNNIAH